jgi:hypothetical protein
MVSPATKIIKTQTLASPEGFETLHFSGRDLPKITFSHFFVKLEPFSTLPLHVVTKVL